jgi:hypothetical protein
MKVLKGMTGLSGLVLPKFMEPMAGAFPTQGISFGNPLAGINGGDMTFPIVFVILLLSVLFRNSNMMVQGFKPAVSRLCFLVVIAVLSILYLGKHSEFLYFRF